MSLARSPGIIYLLNQHKIVPSRAAEIGVYQGRTSENLLRHYPQLVLFMVDKWAVIPRNSEYAKTGDRLKGLNDTAWEEARSEALDRTVFAGERRIVLEKDFGEAAKEVPDLSLDFVFLDADHSYSGTLRAIQTWHSKVRSGGLVLGHDYWQEKDQHSFSGVVRSVNEWIEKNGLTLERTNPGIWGYQVP